MEQQNDNRAGLGELDIPFIDLSVFNENTEAQKLINDSFNGEKVVFDEKALSSAISMGLVKIELPPGASVMKFIYKNGMFSTIFRKIVNLKIITVIYGYLKDRKVDKEKVLDFIRDVLLIDIDDDNFAEINADFRIKFGKGIDKFATINDIFYRCYTPEYMQQIIEDAGVNEGDIIATATSRVRFCEKVNIDKDFNLVNKTIGGTVNSFNVRKLLGGYSKDDVKGFVNGHIKEELDRYLKELKECEIDTGLTGSIVHNQRLVDKKEELLRKKIDTIFNSVLLHGLARYVEGSTMVVYRLAPIDYHNFHFPFSEGKILTRSEMVEKLADKMEQLSLEGSLKDSYSRCIDMVKDYDNDENNPGSNDPAIRIDGKYISVSYYAITSDALHYNPLMENVRDILFIDTEEYGTIPYVLVGATLVGSIDITARAGETLKMGDKIGHFGFGASTVVMFIPGDKAVPYEHTRKLSKIVYNHHENGTGMVEKEMETYIPIGTPLFYPAEEMK